MRGERFATTLLPYGPVKPRGGLLKSVGTNEAEIAWEPPKGGFTKYVLCVDPNITSTHQLYNRKTPPLERNFYTNGQVGSDISFDKIHVQDYTERELSNLLTETKIPGLNPGETYGIILKTKAGGRFTRKPVFETVLTKPSTVESINVQEVGPNRATLKWVAPDGNKRLRAFRILVTSFDNKMTKEMAVKPDVKKSVNSFLLEDLIQATFYTITIKSVCVFETLKTISDEEKFSFSSLPNSPTNLCLDSSSPNSLTLKWDCPLQAQASHKYKLRIESQSIGYSAEYFIPGDKTTFIFSKLPEIIGTGLKSIVVSKIVFISPFFQE